MSECVCVCVCVYECVCVCVGVVVVLFPVTEEVCRSDASFLWFLSEMVECLINLNQSKAVLSRHHAVNFDPSQVTPALSPDPAL